MIPIIVVSVLIIADLFTRRRDSAGISRVTCICIALLQALYPLFLYVSLADLLNRPGMEQSLQFVAWMFASVYLSLRLMISGYAYLADTDRPCCLSRLGSFYNIAILLGFLASFIGMIAVIATQIGDLLSLFGGFVLLLAIGLICCITIILFPFGLVLIYVSLAVMFLTLLPSALVLGGGALVSGFILAGSIVLGVKSVLAADRAGYLVKKEKILLLIFMSLPLANTVTLAVFRRSLSRKEAAPKRQSQERQSETTITEG